MRCPFCSAVEDRVVDTRPSDNEQVIRRRRECIGCSRRFTTYERVDEILPLVIKKDGRREAFDRAKILGGLKKACSKRPDMGVMSDQMNRTRIGRPSNVSSAKKVPTPPSKRPRMPGSSGACGMRPSIHQMAHWSVFSS